MDKRETLHIGCHLSSSKGYLNMGQTAADIDADTFAFFTRNPRGGKAKDIDPEDAAAFNEFAAEHGFATLVAHAPYTLNPAAKDERVAEFARETLADDLVHPGSHVKQGAGVGIEKIAATLNAVLAPEQTTTVLLETMAGKGTEVGRSFEEIAAIIERVELDSHVGVCLDTCHIWDGGYDIVDDLDGVLEEFDRIVGLERLRAVHLNDSKNPCGAHKDRHEEIGEGHIGFEALSAVTRHPALRHLPFILETPNELDGYADEISRLRAAWK